MGKTFHITCVGKLNRDTAADTRKQTDLGDKKYRADSPLRSELGGASANVVKAINLLSALYGDRCLGNIVTRVGKEPQQGHYADFGEYRAAQGAYDDVHAFLKHYGISCRDVSAAKDGQSGIAGAITINFGGDIEGKSGRTIVTDPDVSEIGQDSEVSEDKQKPGRLSGQFNNAVNDLTQDVKPILEKELVDNDCVFIDPARPLLASIAADVCVKNDVPYMVDYGAAAWPKDTAIAALLSNVLKNADTLIVPDDAVVEGMTPHLRDPDTLFSKLTSDEYNVRTVIMSNNTHPVRLFHEGEKHEFPVQEAKQAINTKGVGDTRDSAFIFFLAKGDNVLMAAEKATAVATIRIQYPGDEWTKYFVKEIKENKRFLELFSEDLPEIELATTNAANVNKADEHSPV